VLGDGRGAFLAPCPLRKRKILARLLESRQKNNLRKKEKTK
jgi:hypothetical protein